MAALVSDPRPNAARNTEATWQGLPAELLLRVLCGLPPNELACTARLVCKAAAAGLSSPQHRTVRLSQPSPHGEFVHRWAGPGAMRPLTLARRRLLLCLTAASGCLDNLEWLAERAGCSLTAEVFGAAAAAGRLGVCRWLQQQGCNVELGRTLSVAAGAGQQAVVEWLLANGDTHDENKICAICSAARGGHVGLMDWLLQRFEPGLGEESWKDLVAAAADGCDLPTLQRLLCTRLQGEPPAALRRLSGTLIPAACGSRTPDWKAKVEWLEEKLDVPSNATVACSMAVKLPDALERLTWLRGRGYPWGRNTACGVAVSGNMGALRYLLAEGCPVDPDVLTLAAGAGQLAAVQALHAHGTAFHPAAWFLAIASAAHGGRLPVVAWLPEAGLVSLEQLQQHGAGMLEAAVSSGSMELLAWLRERGCSWGVDTIAAAAEAGSEEALEWLVAQGCLLQAPAYPYADDPYAMAAGNGDWSTLACLHRLGCPLDCLGHQTFLDAVGMGCGVPALRQLLELGCPVDWGRAIAVAARNGGAGVRAWLQEQQLARGEEVADSDDDGDDDDDDDDDGSKDADEEGDEDDGEVADSDDDDDDDEDAEEDGGGGAEETEEAGEEAAAAPDAAEEELGH